MINLDKRVNIKFKRPHHEQPLYGKQQDVQIQNLDLCHRLYYLSHCRYHHNQSKSPSPHDSGFYCFHLSFHYLQLSVCHICRSTIYSCFNIIFASYFFRSCTILEYHTYRAQIYYFFSLQQLLFMKYCFGTIRFLSKQIYIHDRVF